MISTEDDVGLFMREEQLVDTKSMSEMTVELSARMKNVLLAEAEEKVALTIAPPGRLELFGFPYFICSILMRYLNFWK